MRTFVIPLPDGLQIDVLDGLLLLEPSIPSDKRELLLEFAFPLKHLDDREHLDRLIDGLDAAARPGADAA